MKLILFSGPDDSALELKVVHQLFDEGLEYFHVRKPKFSTGDLKYYLNRIDRKYRNRVIIHSHHELCIPYKLRGIHLTEKHRNKKYWQSFFMLKYIKFRRPNIEVTVSYHTIGNLKRHNPVYSYVFLSPIFDSISKLGYRSTFNEDSLRQMLAKTSCKVIALGGVDEGKIAAAREFGFHGVALLGSIWKSSDPVEKFKRIKLLCEQNGNT